MNGYGFIIPYNGNEYMKFSPLREAKPQHRDPCPFCEGNKLEISNDRTSIRCRGCGTIMPAEFA